MKKILLIRFTDQ